MEMYNIHQHQRRACSYCRWLPWRCLLASAIVALLVFLYILQHGQVTKETPENPLFAGIPRNPNISRRVVAEDKLLTPEFIQSKLRSAPIKNIYDASMFKFLRPHEKSNEEEESEEEDSAYTKAQDVPVVNVIGAECDKIVIGDQKAINSAITYQKRQQIPFTADTDFPDITDNCEDFIEARRYIMKPVSQEEAEFPIAFSIVMFKDVDQFERLLRAIYRPQNFYCVHADKKADLDILQAVTSIVKCFPNVFMSSKSINVNWGTFSVLEPELICMEDLIKFKKWKYFINLTGQEFPLKTNLDLVKILKAFNGSNNMEGTVRRRNKDRTMFVHNGYYKTHWLKDPPLLDITLAKGSVHITATRSFVEFVLDDPAALTFRKWVKDTGVPDETFFSSLNHSPQLGVPGAYKGKPETSSATYPFLTRFKNWGGGVFDYPCAGKRERLICIFALGDLKLLSTRRELFANKFHADYHPLAYSCMEQLHYNRTRNEIIGSREFDVQPYTKYEFIWNHV